MCDGEARMQLVKEIKCHVLRAGERNNTLFPSAKVISSSQGHKSSVCKSGRWPRHKLQMGGEQTSFDKLCFIAITLGLPKQNK